MSSVSINPSATLSNNDGLDRGESYEPSPMLESYRREAPTVTERLLGSGKGNPSKDRLDAAMKQISTFNQQWSK
ncbi:hypothetical protein F5Y08DRAFT_319101 [Xylaria arbuscula]|nr:hypothetical protein F5Y08DRAFT_319101 [Xylaria arbuscula]